MPMRTMEESYFPMFFRLAGRKVLVVGAGNIGTRRVETLLSFGADVLAVAPEGSGRMEELVQDAGRKRIEEVDAGRKRTAETDAGEAADMSGGGRLTWERRRFGAADLDGVFFAVAAADDPAVNDQIADLCRSRGILVNHAGDRSQCDFYFPAVAREGKLVVGISSSGQDHRLVRKTAAALREWLRNGGQDEGK